MSPAPSAYGVSPMATTATSYDASASAPFALVSSTAFGAILCTAPHSVLPPPKSAFGLPPCQVIDQPPDWLARLSALLPATSTLAVRASGSTWPLFLSSTSDL